MDDEIKSEGNSVNYKYRMHDPRLGRFFAIDPLAAKYPHNSPYAFSENMVIHAIELEGLESVVIVSGASSTWYTSSTGEKFLTYDTKVYHNMTESQYNVHKTNGTLPKPDYTTQLARDANDIAQKGKTVEHSGKRYGKNNETPPGTYFLFKPGTNGDYGGGAYNLYLGDENGSRVIDGPDGTRAGIAIHQYDPRDSQGCLTTCSGSNTDPVKELINNIPDLNIDSRPVQIVLESREVEKSSFIGTKGGSSANGTKYKGTQEITLELNLPEVTVKPKQ
jgi:hypothetical protein